MWVTKEQLIAMYEGDVELKTDIIRPYRGEEVIAALVTEQNFQAAQSVIGEGDL